MTPIEPRPDTPAPAEPPAPPLPVSPPAAGPVEHPPGSARRWRSSDLLGDATEAEIEHAGGVYRLRRTLLGKLILTK